MSVVGLAAALMATTAPQTLAFVVTPASSTAAESSDAESGAAVSAAAPDALDGASSLLEIAPPAPSPIPATMYPDGQATRAAPPQADAAADKQAIGEPDILIVGRHGPTPGDPLEAINEQSFKLTQKVDVAVVAPTSRVYRRIVPTPIRDGLGNFFRNLHEPDNFLNFVAQHKIGKAAETVARFVINSTLGVAGLFDIARRKPFHLPQRFNSLSNTMGFYGIGPGPYFFVPGVGPTTLRDFIGNAVDGLVLPRTVGKPFTSPAYTIPSSVFRSLEHRVRIDDKLEEIKADPNPYAAARNYYLARRQAEIDHLKGRDNPRADGNTFPGGTPPPVKATPANNYAPVPTPVTSEPIAPLDIPPFDASKVR